MNLALCFRFEFCTHNAIYQFHTALFILLTFLVDEILGKFIYKEDL